MSQPATGLRGGGFRRDLATRATLFAVFLLAVLAAVCMAAVAAIQFNIAERQGREMTSQLVSMTRAYFGNSIQHGDPQLLQDAMKRLAAVNHVQRASLHGLEGAVLAESRPAPALEAEADRRIARRALEAGALVVESRDGVVRSAHPTTPPGGLSNGALVISASRGSIMNSHLKLFAPVMLLIFGCLAVATPLIFLYVRRILSPLRELTDFAAQMTPSRLGKQISIRTGDEFEALADAFNHMSGRLEASMRRIQQLAFVDPITQLPNQDRFARDLNDCIARAEKEGGLTGVILFEFTRVRRLLDTLEAEAVQELMGVIAQRLVQAVRTVDRVVRVQSSQTRPAMVACLRNHDFAILAPLLMDASEAARFAQLVNTAMNQPFDWRDHKMLLGAACGVALAPRDGCDADTVLRHATMARAAARSGGAGLKLFTKALDREAVSRVTFEREIHAALERSEFRAFFQPKIDFATGRIEAAEALARWVRPDKTIISPAKFIPAAEENGLVGAISDAILREACWKAAAWAREGLPIHVSVNVSALQFRSDRFPEHVERVLQHAGLSPHFLELEITETVAMEDPARAVRLIDALKRKGVRFAIDDFGCGHSSLAALTKLPFDVIKIDQQFVRGLERGDRQAPAIVETILAMARTLDLTVVAEGVERREEADFLSARGCRYGQGFLYGAAMAPAEFVERLRAQRAAHAAA